MRDPANLDGLLPRQACFVNSDLSSVDIRLHAKMCRRLAANRNSRRWTGVLLKMKMFLHWFLIAAGVGICMLAGSETAMGQIAAGADSGFATFQLKCFTCHGKANMPQAPSPAALRELSPERLYAKLNSAAPDPHASLGLTDDQNRKAAESIAYRLIGSAESGEAARMPNRARRILPWRIRRPNLAGTAG